MVTLFVMSIVMVGIFQIFQEGMQLFRTNTQAADSQKAAIKVLGKITSELVNAIPDVTKSYSTVLGDPPPPGIVFATSLDANGAVRFDPVNGVIYWQRYICYYFSAPPAGSFSGKVYRTELPVPNENSGGTGHRDVLNVVKPFVQNTSITTFAGTAGAKNRQIADGISGFDIQVYTGSLGGTAQTLSYDIVVEAGSPQALKLRNSYYIKVSTRVTPRG